MSFFRPSASCRSSFRRLWFARIAPELSMEWPGEMLKETFHGSLVKSIKIRSRIKFDELLELYLIAVRSWPWVWLAIWFACTFTRQLLGPEPLSFSVGTWLNHQFRWWWAFPSGNGHSMMMNLGTLNGTSDSKRSYYLSKQSKHILTITATTILFILANCKIRYP